MLSTAGGGAGAAWLCADSFAASFPFSADVATLLSGLQAERLATIIRAAIDKSAVFFMASILLKAKQIFKGITTVNVLILLTLGFFTFLMARITAEYIPYNTDVGFLQIKQDYIDIDHWRIAFFVHVYTSMWALLAGFTQFSSQIQSYYPRAHRALGYVYVTNVLLITGPASLVMGLYANGGPTSKIAFVALAIGWITFTSIALVKAKNGDFEAHRNFMIRSYALTLSALTLRAWKYAITNSVELPPMDVYRAVAWLGWVPNLIAAEMLIRRYYLNEKMYPLFARLRRKTTRLILR
jgi:uncharacterized membrane protein